MNSSLQKLAESKQCTGNKRNINKTKHLKNLNITENHTYQFTETNNSMHQSVQAFEQHKGKDTM